MEASVIPLRKVASLKSLSTATSMLKRKTRVLRYWTLDPDSYNMFDNGSFLRRRKRFKKKDAGMRESRGVSVDESHTAPLSWSPSARK